MTPGLPAPGADVSAVVRRQMATPRALVLLVLAAGAWMGLAALTDLDMTSARVFVPAWALMMAAMMLPAVAPVASLYARSIRPRAGGRTVAFVTGYLVVWALTALPAYGLSLVVQRAVAPSPAAARAVAAAIFAACGLYQLGPWKERCLRHCRSPMGQLVRYASFRGRTRDVRVGIHHAGYCVGCCWSLMLLLFAFGTMALPAALALSALVAAEKLSPRGPLVARVAGWAALALAVAALALPGLAPGLAPMPAMQPAPM